MKWMKERDLLIAQTMAFVQSVTGNKPDAAAELRQTAIEAAPVEAVRYALETVEPPALPQKDIQIPRPRIPSDIRAEIESRVASFRAHQERFHRERDAYCSATLARIHTAVGGDSVSAPLRK